MTQQEKILKLEDLKKQIEDMKSEVRYLVEDIDKSKLDFDTWVRLLPISKNEAPVLRSFVDDWIERYQTVDLDMILDLIEDMECKDPNLYVLFNLKRELMALDFNSMVYD